MKKTTFANRYVEHITYWDIDEENDHEYIQKILKIAKASNDVNVKQYFNFIGKPLISCFEDIQSICDSDMALNILLGKDWFILYDNNTDYIYILDCLRAESENPNERRQQLIELNQAFNYILYKSLKFKDNAFMGTKAIVTDFREDTSYYIYLFKKRHGEIEQIGGDFFSTWGHSENIPFSSSDQEEFFKNFRQIKKPKKLKKTCFHSISFRPTEKTIKKLLENRNKYKNLYPQGSLISEDDNFKQ